MTAGVVQAEPDQVMHPKLAHIAERHRRARRVWGSFDRDSPPHPFLVVALVSGTSYVVWVTIDEWISPERRLGPIPGEGSNASEYIAALDDGGGTWGFNICVNCIRTDLGPATRGHFVSVDRNQDAVEMKSS
jgi:hypothetical protein